MNRLADVPKTPVVEDFSKGLQDWQVKGAGLSTYKFQSPLIDVEGKNLCLAINPKGHTLSIHLRADSKFLGRGLDQGSFSLNRTIKGAVPQDVVIRPEDFEGDKDKVLEWGKITTFNLSIHDHTAKAPVDLSQAAERDVLSLIKMVDAK